MQCAEPVTGSSSMPEAGAKNRDTKSYPGGCEAVVTITPRALIDTSAAQSGLVFDQYQRVDAIEKHIPVLETQRLQRARRRDACRHRSNGKIRHDCV